MVDWVYMIDSGLKKQIQQSLSQNQQVVAAYVLGSFISGQAGKESDFDLAVVVRNKAKLYEKQIYQSLAHIHFPKNLDLSVVDRSSSPLFLFQMISKGEGVYEKSTTDKVKFEAFVLHIYYDNAHMRNIYYAQLKHKFSD